MSEHWRDRLAAADLCLPAMLVLSLSKGACRRAQFLNIDPARDSVIPGKLILSTAEGSLSAERERDDSLLCSVHCRNFAGYICNLASGFSRWLGEAFGLGAKESYLWADGAIQLGVCRAEDG